LFLGQSGTIVQRSLRWAIGRSRATLPSPPP